MPTQPVRYTVQVGTIPEDFCGTPQELANIIATRLVVTPSDDFSSFVSGSIEPSSDVGPWLKDGLEWWVWDNNIGKYRPIAKTGFNTMVGITTTGSFTVPFGIFKLKIEAWGGGGGGFPQTAGAGAGGGGGGYCLGIFDVNPGDVLPITIGAAGVGGVGAGNAGTAGGNTTVKGMTAAGGQAAVSRDAAGDGGQGSGATLGIQGGAGMSGGSADLEGGEGGDSPRGGSGGQSNIYRDGKFPGGGGSGGSNQTVPTNPGGNGAAGAVYIEY